MGNAKRGYLLGVLAYILWGMFPIYWKLLKPAAPGEILAHRMLWSAVFVAVLIAVMRGHRTLRVVMRDPRLLIILAVATVLISLNWGTYVYGVNSDQVVETSLGYFITPLTAVVLGVIVLRERPRPAQWVAVGIATTSVAVLTWDYGRLPYIALILAGSWSVYSLIKKRVPVGPVDGMFLESGFAAPLALAYIIWLPASAFGHISTTHTILMALAGVVTALPLLLFADAAQRLPLTDLGILQYIAPVLQFGCGVLIYHEPMPPVRVLGFALICLALIIFTTDGIAQARRTARLAPKPAPMTV